MTVPLVRLTGMHRTTKDATTCRIAVALAVFAVADLVLTVIAVALDLVAGASVPALLGYVYLVLSAVLAAVVSRRWTSGSLGSSGS